MELDEAQTMAGGARRARAGLETQLTERDARIAALTEEAGRRQRLTADLEARVRELGAQLDRLSTAKDAAPLTDAENWLMSAEDEGICH